jgi:uncharacterized membrane protein YgcG
MGYMDGTERVVYCKFICEKWGGKILVSNYSNVPLSIPPPPPTFFHPPFPPSDANPLTFAANEQKGYRIPGRLANLRSKEKVRRQMASLPTRTCFPLAQISRRRKKRVGKGSNRSGEVSIFRRGGGGGGGGG